MPDWTYQTLFKPVFRKLPFETVTAIVNATMGKLGHVPGGKGLIRLMGHMHPPHQLSDLTHAMGRTCSPTGLGSDIVFDGKLAASLSQFGVGYLCFGPVAYHEGEFVLKRPPYQWTQDGGYRFDSADCRSELKQRHVAFTLAIARTLQKQSKRPLLFWRMAITREDLLEYDSAQAWRTFCHSVRPDGLIIDMDLMDVMDVMDSLEHEKTMTRLAQLIKAFNFPVLMQLPKNASCAQLDLWSEVSQRAIHTEGGAITSKAGGARLNGFALSYEGMQASEINEHIREFRSEFSSDQMLLVQTPCIEPIEILEHQQAGADVIWVDQGLVNAGPGFPKRCNRLLQHACLEASESEPENDLKRDTQYSWFWAFCIGIAMFGGGILTMVIGLSRVLLPYDESLTGLDLEKLHAINDRLVAFMQHDRVTLAGTMLSLGILYMSLAWFGMRQAQHWARVAYNISVWIGFFSFFLFLGFGYFDPFHAFVAACLFVPMVVQVILDDPIPRKFIPLAHINQTNSKAWRRAQWGQLIMVLHGATLIIAGLTICVIGVTHVFVAEDLDFMQTTSFHLHQAHPSLVPLVAHDRASFGGMLLSTGIVVFLSSLWGIEQGRAWLWWSTLIAGSIAYVATLAIHLSVGYHHLTHLVPVYGGLLGLWLASLLMQSYCLNGQKTDKMA